MVQQQEPQMAVADQVFGTLERAASGEWMVKGVEYGKRHDWQVVD